MLLLRFGVVAPSLAKPSSPEPISSTPPGGTLLPHALRQKRLIRGMEVIAERPDGTRVPFIPYPTPLFDASGDVTGAINVLVDVFHGKDA